MCAEAVAVQALSQRFCHKCAKFHELGAFDGKRRTCSARLKDHNHRQRARRLLFRKAPAPAPSSNSDSSSSFDAQTQVSWDVCFPQGMQVVCSLVLETHGEISWDESSQQRQSPALSTIHALRAPTLIDLNSLEHPSPATRLAYHSSLHNTCRIR